MKFIIASIASIFLAINYGCDREGRHTKTSEEQDMERADLIAGRITSIFSKNMYKTKGLVTRGTGGGGGGYLGSGLHMLSVSFESYQKMDILQARKLLLVCVDEFLSEINAAQDFIPHARQFPFTYKNVNIAILFIDKKKSDFIESPAIASVGINEGLVMYNTFHDDQLDTIKEETHEESLKIVKEESISPSA